MIFKEIVSLSRKRASKIGKEISKNPVKVCNKGFTESLEEKGLSIVSEVKPSSPSRDFPGIDPINSAKSMEKAGASAISVLTEPFFFNGSIKNLEKICKTVEIPVLRKDFIVDKKQIYQSSQTGCDAILLIALLLGEKLSKFVDLSQKLGLDTLVEVHSEKELKLAKKTGTKIIGVNNRDLETLKIDLAVSEKLLPKIGSRLAVAESGLRKKKDLEKIFKAGADAALIGSAIMENNVEKKTRFYSNLFQGE